MLLWLDSKEMGGCRWTRPVNHRSGDILRSLPAQSFFGFNEKYIKQIAI